MKQTLLRSWILRCIVLVIVVALSCLLGQVIGVVVASIAQRWAVEMKISGDWFRVIHGVVSGLITGTTIASLSASLVEEELRRNSRHTFWLGTVVISVSAVLLGMNPELFTSVRWDFKIQLMLVAAVSGAGIGLLQWSQFYKREAYTLLWIVALLVGWLTAAYLLTGPLAPFGSTGIMQQ